MLLALGEIWMETLRGIIYIPNLEKYINGLISGVEALELDV